MQSTKDLVNQFRKLIRRYRRADRVERMCAQFQLRNAFYALENRLGLYRTIDLFAKRGWCYWAADKESWDQV